MSADALLPPAIESISTPSRADRSRWAWVAAEPTAATCADGRRLEDDVERVWDDIRLADAELVVVYGGVPPADERVAAMIGALDRSTDAAVCVDGAGDAGLVAATWQRLARSGRAAVTIAGGASGSDHPPAFVVRRAVVPTQDPTPTEHRWRNWSGWAAILVVAVFAVTQVTRIILGTISLGPSEIRWLRAAEQGSVNDLPSELLAGSSLWPAAMRFVFDVFGLAGVRCVSIALSVVAVGCAAGASSLLFGRWAARTTALLLTVGLIATDVTVRATPTALTMAALAIALLGVALVESSGRRSWTLLSGIASTVAVAASYQAIVFVIPLTLYFVMMRGRSGWVESRALRLVLLGGILAWFLPTRTESVRFIVMQRPEADLSDTLADVLLLSIIGLTVAIGVVWGVGSPIIRRRVLVLSTALLAVPFARQISGTTVRQGVDLSIAMVLVAPAVGGALAYRIVSRFRGPAAVTEGGGIPHVLLVDPAEGRVVEGRVHYPNRQVRMAALLIVVGSAWYLPWAAVNIDWRNWWIAVPFLTANVVVVATALLSAYNNRTRAIPLEVAVAAGHEPLVGVIVPTCGEPVDMVVNTVRSIVQQDWPVDRLRIIVSDDAHDDAVRDRFTQVAAELPPGVLVYHRPPRRGDPARRGESKAGNLNSALGLVVAAGCEYVETRDADDLVGSASFLRSTVSQLMLDPGLGFAQTIKETRTSPGDPFNNNEPFFYRGMMLARNADHGVFPCGSGLVWRRTALHDVGDFPVWNLVEDLHSGVLALRAGWRGVYVPIVGAIAQHAPEDVANVFKQRGTWALDTIRLAAFDRFRGLPWRARLHFVEQTMFYLLSIPLLMLMMTPMLGLLFDRFPLATDPTTYAVHFWGFALAIELMLLALAADQPAGSLWRSRLLWVGLAPVYATSAIRALWYGPGRKPSYRVTRKTHDHRVYVRMVTVHWCLLAGTVVALVVAFIRDALLLELDLGSVYWAIVGLIGLGSFMRLTWFGVDVRRTLSWRPAVSES